MSNPFIHIELQTQDLVKARTFYEAVFNWRLHDVPGMAYTMIDAGEGTGGGMMQAKSPGVPSQWIPFIQVDDVPGTTDRVRALGGIVLKGPAEAPGYGWYSVLTDPSGAAFGIWTPQRGEGR